MTKRAQKSVEHNSKSLAVVCPTCKGSGIFTPGDQAKTVWIGLDYYDPVAEDCQNCDGTGKV
jgi:hypothetical protein